MFTTKSQASSQPVMKGETTVAMLIIFITKKSVRANDEHVWNQRESKMHTEPLLLVVSLVVSF